MSTSDLTGVRRPPSVAVSGNASPLLARPSRAPTTGTPRKVKKKGLKTPTRVSSTPQRLSLSSTVVGGPPTAKGGAAGPPEARPGHHSSALTPLKLSRATASTKTATSASGGRSVPSMSGFTPPTRTLPTPHDGDGANSLLAGGALSLSPGSSYAPTAATTAHRSLQPTSSVGAASVAAATSAVAGERYEPTGYKIGYSLQGDYSCIAVVPQTAALWVGNSVSGSLDMYSGTTGKLVVSLPARGQGEQGRRRGVKGQPGPAVGGSGGTERRNQIQELIFPSTSPAATPKHAASGANVGGGGTHGAAAVVPPTALSASQTHMWVGFADGGVAVYDHLVLTLVTEGRFHHSPVVRIAFLDDGTAVSASAEGSLVHWGTEDAGFEAIVCLPSPCSGGGAEDHRRKAGGGGGGVGGARGGGDDELSALVALPRSSVVLCGFHSGAVYAVNVLAAARLLHAGAAPSYTPTLLSLHEGRINALAVLGSSLFSAAEDGSVCCTRLEFSLSTKEVGGAAMVEYGVAPSRVGRSQAPPKKVMWHLLKRIHTVPPVRGLLADRHTLSLYVAYADGLVERWSGNPDDDFGVEEVIREGMRATTACCDSAKWGEEEEGASRDGGARRGKHSPEGPTGGWGGDAGGEVTGLLALNAVETLQVLALSSNGMNKVWYGHRSLLEESVSASISALNAVVCEDARDTAAWRERMALLKVKEGERRAKYILILGQLSEQRLLLRYYERWRRRVIGHSVVRSSKEVVVAELALRVRCRVLARYFGRWATFYDAQQKRIRRYALAGALAKATTRAALASVLHRWQMRAVRRRAQSSMERCAAVLATASNALVAGPCFHRWLCFAKGKAGRREATAAVQRSSPLGESQLSQIARKAKQQTLRRALASWLRVAEQRRRDTTVQETWGAYLNLYMRLQNAKTAKSIFQGWRHWASRRSRHTALAAVAELRGQQCRVQLLHVAFLRWCQFIHQKRLAAHAAEIAEVEAKLKRAEAESGSDAFDKLQLQKRIDQLILQQEKEDWLLQQDQKRLRALQEDRDAILRQREHEQQRASDRQADGSVLLPVSQDTIASLPVTGSHGSSSGRDATVSRGLMTTHANYFRYLVDQQRLSPVVLACMPRDEAVDHVMSQLKGIVLNLYTDMALFRRVKDKRTAGATAVGVFLEAFSEVKRPAVTPLRRGSAAATGRAARWPLSFEALDSIPTHQCTSTLIAIKTMAIAYDLIPADSADLIAATSEEVVANADWIFLLSCVCHLRRKPQLPVNNRM